MEPIRRFSSVNYALASEAESGGLRPGEAEVYSFRVAPALGGAVDLENVEVSDFVVATNIAGQIHQQSVAELSVPVGAKTDLR